jgi:hypothetical protein
MGLARAAAPREQVIDHSERTVAEAHSATSGRAFGRRPTVYQKAYPKARVRVEPLAQRLVSRHIAVMTDRPCKPGADLKGIWQMLLPGTPFPACGISENPEFTASQPVETPSELPDEGSRSKARQSLRWPRRNPAR